MEAPRLFVHVGLQKTGTSFLQRILWDSEAGLARQDVEMVPGSKQAMFRLMLDVRGRFNAEIDPPAVTRAVERLPAELRRARRTAIISQESLATASPEQIARLLAATAGRETHVIVTLRDLGRQIPSAWQQSLQAGHSERLGRFVDRLEQTVGADSRHWQAMDAPAVLTRWAEQVPAERIHVVTVAPSGSEPTVLLDRFCSVVGLDPTTLTIEATRRNRSLRAEQAEVLRRVNARLPPELTRRDVYGDIGKRYFAVQVLGDDQGTSIRLPAERREWCADLSERYIESIQAGGYQVVGDLADLRPHERDFASAGVKVSPQDVADVATRALATILADKASDRAELRDLRAAAARTTSAQGTPGRAVALGRRVAARLRQRLRRADA